MHRMEGVGRGEGWAQADVQHRTFTDINYERVWTWEYVDPFPR